MTVVEGPPTTSAASGIGASPGRQELRRILTGGALYVGDVPSDDALHAAFVRSPHAHARIRRIDPSAALRHPAVHAVLTADDLAATVNPIRMTLPIDGVRPIEFPCLAEGRVRFHGEPVAVVLARTRHEAEDGRDLVEVAYEPVPPVASVEAALEGGAPAVHDDIPDNLVYRDAFHYGDPDGTFANAATVVSEEFVQSRVTNAPMEPRGGLAAYDPETGRLTYTVATQTPHALRQLLASLMDMPTGHVRIVTPDIGGSFGQKSGIRAEDLALCAASRLLSRPVAWMEDRRENLEVGGQARDERLVVDAALDDQGVLVGLRARLTLDHGAYPVVPSAVGAAVHTMVRVLLPGPYRIRGYTFEARVVATNKAPYNAYRGPWQIETWVRERLMDVAARVVGEEPIAYRRRNLAARAGEMVTVTGASLVGTTLDDLLGRLEETIDVQRFRHEQVEARQRGKWLGLGIAALLEPAPGPPAFRQAIGFPLRAEPVRVRFDADGQVEVLTGQSPHGQGHRTTLAQVAASALDLPLDRVRVITGDTDITPPALAGTGGSRSATMAGGAVWRAARALRTRLEALAADRLGVEAHDIEWGGLEFRSPSGAVPLNELVADRGVASTAPTTGSAGPLDVTAEYDGHAGDWAQAVHACWVDVDLATGRVTIPRYLVIADCGTVIHPGIVDGQVRGGVVQGIGSVLFERVVHDRRARPLASTFRDYLLPLAGDVPDIEVHHVHRPHRGDADFRGVGEGGAIAAPAALTNAIEDALAHLGVRITEQHLPPSRILELAGVIDPEES